MRGDSAGGDSVGSQSLTCNGRDDGLLYQTLLLNLVLQVEGGICAAVESWVPVSANISAGVAYQHGKTCLPACAPCLSVSRRNCATRLPLDVVDDDYMLLTTHRRSWSAATSTMFLS